MDVGHIAGVVAGALPSVRRTSPSVKVWWGLAAYDGRRQAGNEVATPHQSRRDIVGRLVAYETFSNKPPLL